MRRLSCAAFPNSAIRIPHLSDSCWQSRSTCVRWAVMKRVRRFVALAFLLGYGAVIGAEPARLPADQLAKAVRNDSITIPTPGELLRHWKSQGNRIGSAKCADQSRPATKTAPRSRSILAV